MTATATREKIIGRLIGDGGEFIAVTVADSPRGMFALGVSDRPAGPIYVTWAYESRPDSDALVMSDGHYFDSQHYGSAHAAFLMASHDLEKRKYAA